jgi:hypothetical protein
MLALRQPEAKQRLQITAPGHSLRPGHPVSRSGVHNLLVRPGPGEYPAQQVIRATGDARYLVGTRCDGRRFGEIDVGPRLDRIE